MAILTFSTPRNRAVLITVLLVMEFMAIVWLRESSPDEGRMRVPFHSGASGRDRHAAADGRAVRHEESHLQRMQHEQRQRGGYVYTGAGTGAEAVIRSGGTVLQARAGTGPDPQMRVESLSGSERNQEGKEGAHEEPLRLLHVQPQLHQSQQPELVRPPQQVEQQQQQQPRLQPMEQGSIPSTSTRQNPPAPASALPAKAETLARGDISTTNQPGQGPTTSSKNTMSDNAPKAKAGAGKHRSSLAHEKNQRGGFKSTKERKLAQLIPALDENGVIIEDHFISPRDTDGDGIPDSYVLLRPSGNSRYMMDVGLFDEDLVPPPPPPVPPVPPVSTAALVTAAPQVPVTTSESSVPLAAAVPVIEVQVPAAPQAPSVPSLESAPTPEPPGSEALLSIVIEVPIPEAIETSVEPATAPTVAPAEAPIP